MGSFAIISCKIFEDELAYLISKDELSPVLFILDDSTSQENFYVKLTKYGVNPRKIILVKDEELRKFKYSNEYSLLIWMKPLALHERPKLLRNDIIESVKKLKDYTNYVLLLYGLCGNSLSDISNDPSIGSPGIFITPLFDEDSCIVDDCIGCLLGGRNEYLRIMNEFKSSFFLSPTWARYWKELLHIDKILNNYTLVGRVKSILKELGYRYVVKIHTGLEDPHIFDQHVEEFSNIFNLEKVNVNGTLKIIEDNYNRIRRRALSHSYLTRVYNGVLREEVGGSNYESNRTL
ncbi:MAG: DUF1638 domain-containing protein [Candidatus Korarchaeum sp.]|nr:DUF1638 domain-containing protein [Candidatus Korarchaeum sp.]